MDVEQHRLEDDKVHVEPAPRALERDDRGRHRDEEHERGEARREPALPQREERDRLQRRRVAVRGRVGQRRWREGQGCARTRRAR